MTKRDVLVHLAELNPVPDPSSLAETVDISADALLQHQQRRPHMESVEPKNRSEKASNRVRGPLLAVAATALVVIVGLAIAVLPRGESPVAAGDAPLEITFDGSSCIYDGPGTLFTGTGTIVATNATDDTAWIDVGRIVDEGKTLEDMNDLIAENPEITRPAWISGVSYTGTLSPQTSKTMRPGNLLPGEYAIACGTFPQYVHGSAGFFVVEG